MAKDNICVIYDDDESYAKRLMGIINDSKDIPYRAKVFTKEEEFNRYILANKTDVLMVISPGVAQEIEEAKRLKKQIRYFEEVGA